MGHDFKFSLSFPCEFFQWILQVLYCILIVDLAQMEKKATGRSSNHVRKNTQHNSNEGEAIGIIDK